MQILAQPTCTNPSTTSLPVAGGIDVLNMQAKGNRIFWCNGGKFEYTKKGHLHGDIKATLTSADGQWTGVHYYRPSDGLPEWDLKAKNGTTMKVIATQQPQVRGSKSDFSDERRKVVTYTGPAPKIAYVIRMDSKSGPLPTSCKGDQDAYVPITATFQFIAC